MAVSTGGSAQLAWCVRILLPAIAAATTRGAAKRGAVANVTLPATAVATAAGTRPILRTAGAAATGPACRRPSIVGRTATGSSKALARDKMKKMALMVRSFVRGQTIRLCDEPESRSFSRLVLLGTSLARSRPTNSVVGPATYTATYTAAVRKPKVLVPLLALVLVRLQTGARGKT
eukprot:3403995-Prymnesium_polylepis.3